MLLNDLVKQLTPLKRYQSEYYKVDDFMCALRKFKYDKIEVVDTLILPFYLVEEKGVYEIYYYELNISIVDKRKIDTYLLMRSGYSSVDEIDVAIREKINNLYLEVIKPDNFVLIKDIIKYIQMLQTAKDLIDVVISIPEFGDFSKENLYFQIY